MAMVYVHVHWQCKNKPHQKKKAGCTFAYQSANSFARWTVLVSQPLPSLLVCQQDAVEVISIKDFSLCNQHVFLLQMQPQLKCSPANRG